MEYDINDPTDLDIMRAKFDMISHADWDEYLEMAEEQGLGYKNVNILKTGMRKAGIAKYLSPKVLHWILSVIDRLDSYDPDEYEDEEE